MTKFILANRARLRVIIWAVAFMLVALSIALLPGALSKANSAATARAGLGSVQSVNLAGGGAAGATSAVVADSPRAAYITAKSICSGSGTQAQIAAICPPDSSPQNVLPISRWGSNGATGFYTNLSVTDAISAISVFIASMSFTAANTIWQLLFSIANFASSSNILNEAAVAINSMFSTLYKAILSSGVIGIALLIAAVSVGVAFLRRQGSPFKVLATFIIPLAVMQGLAMAIATPAATTSGSLATPQTKVVSPSSQAVPTGSPAWLAQTGTNFIGDAITPLSNLFGSGSSSVSNVALAEPNCQSYVAALNGAYDGAASKNAGTPSSTLQSISNLWQTSYLTPWEFAQFGNTTGASAAYCHLLEYNAGSSAVSQQAISEIAYPYLFSTATPAQPSVVPTAGATASNTTPTGIYGLEDSSNETVSSDTKQSILLGYSACSYANKTWTVDPGFASLETYGSTSGTTQAPTSVGRAAAINPQPTTPATTGSAGGTVAGPSVCQSWWSNGNTDNFWVASNYQDLSPAAQASAPGVQQAYAEMSALLGHNGPSALLYGFVAFLSAVVTAYGLAGLVVGSAIAEIGLVLLLILMPVSLTFLSAAATKSKALGVRMLKLTGGFLVGKFALALASTALLIIISILYDITSAMNLGTTLAVLVSPSLGVLVLKFMLKQLKLGNMGSIRGAARLPLAAAAAIAGERALSAKMARNTESALSPRSMGNRAQNFMSARAREAARASEASNKAAQEGSNDTKKTTSSAAEASAKASEAANARSASLTPEKRTDIPKIAKRASLSRDRHAALAIAASNTPVTGKLSTAAMRVPPPKGHKPGIGMTKQETKNTVAAMSTRPAASIGTLAAIPKPSTLEAAGVSGRASVVTGIPANQLATGHTGVTALATRNAQGTPTALIAGGRGGALVANPALKAGGAAMLVKETLNSLPESYVAPPAAIFPNEHGAYYEALKTALGVYDPATGASASAVDLQAPDNAKSLDELVEEAGTESGYKLELNPAIFTSSFLDNARRSAIATVLEQRSYGDDQMATTLYAKEAEIVSLNNSILQADSAAQNVASASSAIEQCLLSVGNNLPTPDVLSELEGYVSDFTSNINAADAGYALAFQNAQISQNFMQGDSASLNTAADLLAQEMPGTVLDTSPMISALASLYKNGITQEEAANAYATIIKTTQEVNGMLSGTATSTQAYVKEVSATLVQSYNTSEQAFASTATGVTSRRSSSSGYLRNSKLPTYNKE